MISVDDFVIHTENIPARIKIDIGRISGSVPVKCGIVIGYIHNIPVVVHFYDVPYMPGVFRIAGLALYFKTGHGCQHVKGIRIALTVCPTVQ